MLVRTNFTEPAGRLLEGEAGLIQFNYEVYPNVGDSVTVRTSPSSKILMFVCKSRHFDFSKTDAPELTIVLDLPS